MRDSLFEYGMLGRAVFFPGPSLYFGEVYIGLLIESDFNGLLKRLLIFPVEISGETILNTLSGSHDMQFAMRRLYTCPVSNHLVADRWPKVLRETRSDIPFSAN